MHWNGAVLDSIDTVVRFAESMTWNGTHPTVDVISTLYATGIKLTKDAMQAVEAHIQRLPGLDKWFVDILPVTPLLEAN